METAQLAGRIVEMSPVGVIFSDRDGVIRVWNAAAEAIFGFAAAEAIGKRVDIVIPAEYHDGHWAGYARAMADSVIRTAPSGALPMIHRSGEEIMVDLTGDLVCDDGGTAIGVVAFCRALDGEAFARSSGAAGGAGLRPAGADAGEGRA